jgi:hypothetical protein
LEGSVYYLTKLQLKIGLKNNAIIKKPKRTAIAPKLGQLIQQFFDPATLIRIFDIP